MTQRASLFGALAAGLMVLSIAPAFAAPQGRILVIDRAAVLRGSKVGQDIVKQVQAYTHQAENDLKAQGQALRSQGEALKTQLAILSADVKKRKMQEFESRQRNLQELAQKKQSLIQGGFMKARQMIESSLGPILQGIMVERGASLLLDRNSVVMGTDAAVDITPLAVQRLNQKLPTIKVELTPLPANIQQQMMQQQQQGQ